MHSFAVGADNFDVVQAQGPDVVRFLQGQLTCDVAAMVNNSQAYGACCNNKGRVIAAFAIVRLADIFYLCMSRGSGAVLIEALRKYLPFYKCELAMAAAGQHQLLALAGPNADAAIRSAGVQTLESGRAVPVDSGWLCKLEGTPARALWWCDQYPQAIMDSLDVQTPGTLEQWEALGLLNGHYPFRQSDTGHYTPQELHYDQNSYVNFSKGCYTGQEIVARMHYRGKPKKQLFLAQLAQPAAARDGQQLLVTDAQGLALGSCRLSRSCENLHLALLELPADFMGNFATLKLADSPLMAGCAFEPGVIQSTFHPAPITGT